MDNKAGLMMGFIVAVAMAFTAGFMLGRDENRKAAVRENAAHYYLDNDNTVRFRWGPKP